MEEQYNLNYINGKFTITKEDTNEKYTFTNKVVKSSTPSLALEDNVYQVFYKLGSKNNKIVYISGKEEPLTWLEDKFEAIILNRQTYIVEAYNKLRKEKLENLKKVTPSYTIEEFFDTEISIGDREDRIEEYEFKTGVKITDEVLLDALDKMKKRLLQESDWTQLPDVQSSMSEEEIEAWVEYRAKLRILDKVDHPRKVEVPTPPNN